MAELTFTGGTLDRCATERAQPGLLDALLADPATRIIALRSGTVAVTSSSGSTSDPGSGLRLVLRPPERADADRLAVFLGRSSEGEHPAYVGVVEASPTPSRPTQEAGEAVWCSLRSMAICVPPSEAAIVATFAALANWHATHTHCPRCGTATEPTEGGWIRRCPAEGSEHFPRTDPAIIVAVVDNDDRLLLARGTGFTASGMSVLAGFVEPGESLAEAVIREVAEEVGVEVADVVYLGDQPWPFPMGLMIGFRARARTTEVSCQAGEIDSARWFTRAEFAAELAQGSLQIAGRLSIARRLIEQWWGGPLEVPEATLRDQGGR